MSESSLQKAARESEERRSSELHTKLDAAQKGICDELGKRGIPYQLKKPGSMHGSVPFWREFESVGGEYVSVEIKPEFGTAMSRQRGKIRIKVGDYGQRQQFPERKTGFDFVAIVDTVLAHVKGLKEKQTRNKDRAKQKDALDAAVSRIKEKLGQPITGVSVAVDHHLHGINIELNGLTEERANEVLNAIKKVFAS
jgi:hypothetical protein